MCSKWNLESLCDMTEEDMDVLLQSYKPNLVPTFDQVRLGETPGEYTFDGSFGWACVC